MDGGRRRGRRPGHRDRPLRLTPACGVTVRQRHGTLGVARAVAPHSPPRQGTAQTTPPVGRSRRVPDTSRAPFHHSDTTRTTLTTTPRTHPEGPQVVVLIHLSSRQVNHAWTGRGGPVAPAHATAAGPAVDASRVPLARLDGLTPAARHQDSPLPAGELSPSCRARSSDIAGGTNPADGSSARASPSRLRALMTSRSASAGSSL